MLRADSFNLAEDAPEALLRSGRAGYYAIISYFDDKLGRLLDCLEETGQRENTIVVCALHTQPSSTLLTHLARSVCATLKLQILMRLDLKLDRDCLVDVSDHGEMAGE